MNLRIADSAELVAYLEALTPSERLRWLADREPGYPLELIPSARLPDADEELIIERDRAVALIRLIDRRGGAWGKLARRLHRRLLHPAYFETRFRAPEPLETWPDDFAIVSGYATTGEAWTNEENRAADRRLRAELIRLGAPSRPITGFSPETGHAEPSWAVVLSIEDACALGRRFCQDAIYHVAGNRLRVLRCAEPRRLVPIGGFRERLEHDPAEAR